MYNEENILTARSIIGDKVYNKEGVGLGDITELLLDPETGKIAYGVLSFKDSGKDKLFAVPYEAFILNNERDTFTLNVDKEMLEKASSQTTYEGKQYFIY